MPNIIENLLRNSGQTQLSFETSISSIVDGRLQVWRQEAQRSFPALLPTIENAFSQYLHQANPSVSPLVMDFGVLQHIGPHLSSQSRDQIASLAQFAQRTLNHYVTQTQSLAENLSRVDPSFNVQINRFLNDIRHAQQDVDRWVSGLSDVTRALNTLPLPRAVGEVLGTINTWVNHVQTFERGVGTVVNTLLNGARDASREIDNLAHRSSELTRELNATVATNTTRRAELRAEINSVQRQVQARQSTLDTTLEGIGQGVELAGSILCAVGNPRLARQVVTVGKATITIVQNIVTLAAGSLAAGPLAPIMAIAGAIGAIFSMFGGNGPDPMQLISDQINRLSEHMNTRFDRIEKMIEQAVKVLGEHIDRHFAAQTQLLNNRFDRVERLVGEFYRQSMENFIGLHAGNMALREAIERYNQRFNRLEEKLTRGFQEIYQEPYRATMDRALSWNEVSRLPMQNRDISKYYHQIRRWVRECVSNLTMAGLDWNNHTAEQLTNDVIGTGLDININLIKGYALNVLRAGRSPGRLINPSAWSEGVRALLTFCERTSRLTEVIQHEEIENTLNRVISDGKQFNDFIVSLKKNPAIFTQLIDDYRNSLISTMRSGFNVLATTQNPDYPITPEAALEAVRFLEAAPANISRLVRNQFIQRVAPAQPQEVPISIQPTEDVHPYNPGGIDRARIVREVLLQVDSATHQPLRFHGQPSQDAYNNARDMRSLGHYAWAVRDEFFQPLHIANAEWEFHRTLALIHQGNYDRMNRHLNDLSNREYVDSQIKIILEFAVRGELRRAIRDNDLPHAELMKKFCERMNRTELNNKLLGQYPEITPLFNQFNSDLRQLNITHRILSIFIALAFSKEYAEEPDWRIYMESLLNGEEINSYIGQDMRQPKPDCVLSVLLTSHIPFAERFKEFLLEKSFSMRIRHNANEVVVGHPLVTTVLKEVSQFKEYFKLKFKKREPVMQETKAAQNRSVDDDENDDNNPHDKSTKKDKHEKVSTSKTEQSVKNDAKTSASLTPVKENLSQRINGSRASSFANLRAGFLVVDSRNSQTATKSAANSEATLPTETASSRPTK